MTPTSYNIVDSKFKALDNLIIFTKCSVDEDYKLKKMNSMKELILNETDNLKNICPFMIDEIDRLCVMALIKVDNCLSFIEANNKLKSCTSPSKGYTVESDPKMYDSLMKTLEILNLQIHNQSPLKLY